MQHLYIQLNILLPFCGFQCARTRAHIEPFKNGNNSRLLTICFEHWSASSLLSLLCSYSSFESSCRVCVCVYVAMCPPAFYFNSCEVFGSKEASPSGTLLYVCTIFLVTNKQKSTYFPVRISFRVYGSLLGRLSCYHVQHGVRVRENIHLLHERLCNITFCSSCI